MEMTEDLTRLAEEGELASQDDSCAVLYGIVRDCAYKIKARATLEKERHISLGMWDTAADGGKPAGDVEA